jgi:asparagine synthase (glutamine-hydrolysing)
MCGIVGSLNLNNEHPHTIKEHSIRRMLAMLRHRGPDEFGIYLDDRIGLGSARLSIIDLSGGQQPITNEDESLWIVFNGEIFNYVELRPQLEKKGHQFCTNTDTEIILHLYEDYGPACLEYLNGQFAIALWDTRNNTLFLARDRLGIRPLFYAIAKNKLLFGSEIKSILAEGSLQAELNPLAIDQVFTFWSPQSPNTAFKGVKEIPPGHFLLVHNQDLRIEQYWRINFPVWEKTTSSFDKGVYIDELRELLIDSTKIRLRADVPVGAYLSGGLDSSITSAIIRNYTGNQLDTFSISFGDPLFDESSYQLKMAEYLGTDHKVVHATYDDIRTVFPEVIWHTETPLTRAGPAPLFLLSRLVRQNNYKVVMTGEGADEFLAGYNIFKETKIRRFWARQPDSDIRPNLLKRLYPYITDLGSGSGAYLIAFFKDGLSNLDDPFYSHAIRWKNTSRIKRFFSPDFLDAYKQVASHTHFESWLPEEFEYWHALSRAQYLEVTTFLSQYLLSSQGDRMAMANSVEGRYPFLDHRVVEFCNQIPPHLKLFGLTEKFILKQLGKNWVPTEIWQRPKTPYRAPIHRSFMESNKQTYVQDLLAPETINSFGVFKPDAVNQLIRKAERGARFSETDDMALLGILSTQLLYQLFIDRFEMPDPISDKDNIKICFRGTKANSHLSPK